MTAKLRLLRMRAGLTLEELAVQCRLTRSYLSKIERGLATPSITAALEIARALDVSVELLFGQASAEAPYTVVRHAELPRDSTVLSTRLIAGGTPHRRMSAFVLRPPVLDSRQAPIGRHEGEEIIYVLEGQVELQVADRKEQLGTGDCAQYDAAVPHKISSLLPEGSLVLTVICSPPEATP